MFKCHCQCQFLLQCPQPLCSVDVLLPEPCQDLLKRLLLLENLVRKQVVLCLNGCTLESHKLLQPRCQFTLLERLFTAGGLPLVCCWRGLVRTVLKCLNGHPTRLPLVCCWRGLVRTVLKCLN